MQAHALRFLLNVAAVFKARGTWLLMIALIVIGAWMRTITIDRGAPVLGLIVYAGALCFFVGMIAVPSGALGALLAARVSRAGFSYSFIQQGAAATAALIVFALHHIGHRPAPWQVWIVMSALAFLAARSAYAIAWGAFRPDKDDGTRHVACRGGVSERQSELRRADSGYVLERRISHCAADERNLRMAWRQLPLRKQLNERSHRK